MFATSDLPIDGQILASRLVNHAAGAFVSFEGRVRKQNDGRAVARLAYELFPELCVSEGEKILSEAKELFGIVDALAVHREGELELGDVAVWVGVIAPHRAAAYQASRYIIDAIKARCPIWKREEYVEGPSEWVGCPSCEHHAARPQEIFSKQERLVGKDGQKRLADSRVLIIGAGGLGCPAALHLAASGVGFLRIVDGDRIEASNLHRQTLFGIHDLSALKAWVAKRRIEELHPYCKVEALAERFSEVNAARIMEDVDLVLDCSDNFGTKYLINDRCTAAGLPFVQASIYQNQAQLISYRPGESACLRCVSPEQPPDGCVESCTDSGVLGASTGIVGSWQALEAIKTLVGKGSNAAQETLYIDLDEGETFRVPRAIDVNCPACSLHKKSFSYESGSETWEKSYETILASRDPERIWVDIRELHESRPSLPDALRMPLSSLDRDALRKPGRTIVLVCEKGLRSKKLASELRAKGWDHIESLRGGLAAVSQKEAPVQGCSGHEHGH